MGILAMPILFGTNKIQRITTRDASCVCSTQEQLRQRFSNACVTLLSKKSAYHHQAYGVGRTWTPDWRCSISNKWGWFQTRRFWHHSWRRRLCTKVGLGHMAGRQDQYPAARSCFVTVRAVMCLPKRKIIYILRRGAEMRWIILTIWSKWWASRAVNIFCLPPRLL